MQTEYGLLVELSGFEDIAAMTKLLLSATDESGHIIHTSF